MSQGDQLRTVALSEINARFSCPLCKGYIIDCVSAEECGHAYCRSCIARHIANGTVNCPACNLLINREEPGEPFQKLKSDPILQRLIYKLVPNLVSKETERRTAYHGSEKVARREIKESVGEGALFFNDRSCVCIELKPRLSSSYAISNQHDETNSTKSSFLRTELGSPLSILVDYVKLQTGTNAKVSLSSSPKAPVLDNNLRLIDLAYLIAWDMSRPLPVYYELIDNTDQPAGRLQPLTPLLRTESNPRSPDKAANNRTQTSSSVLVMAQASRPDYAAKQHQPHQQATTHSIQSNQTSSSTTTTQYPAKLKLKLNKNLTGKWEATSPPATTTAFTYDGHRQIATSDMPMASRTYGNGKMISPVHRESCLKHTDLQQNNVVSSKRPFDQTRDPVIVTKVARVLPFPMSPRWRHDLEDKGLPPAKRFCDDYQLDSESEILKSTGLVPFASTSSGNNIMTIRHILHGHS